MRGCSVTRVQRYQSTNWISQLCIILSWCSRSQPTASQLKMGTLIQPDHFTHILRVLNTNVDGRNKIMYAMTNIRGIGRRFSNFACKKGEVDMKKRAGECSAEDIENLMLIVSNPRAYKTPDWFLNRRKVRASHQTVCDEGNWSVKTADARNMQFDL